MTRRRLAAGLAALAVALVAPAAADAALRWRPCEDGHRCARLTVPLDRTGAVPGAISLRVLRARTFGTRPTGVTLVLGGEPGESAIQLLAGRYSLDEPLETLADAMPANRVVVLDQRGTGGSGPLRCRDLEAATPTDAGREAEACATLLGPRRAFYRTTDTVADIEALRAQLGVERLTLVGLAYGGYVAQRYALAHPQHVERLLLDSPVDAAGLDPLRLDSIAATRRVLPLLCRTGCRGFTRDTLHDTARLSAELAREPLRGEIVGLDGRPRPARITPEELLFTVHSGSRDVLSQVEYPAAVAAALRGDSAALFRVKRRVVLAAKSTSPGRFSAATRAAVLCEELRFPWAWGATVAERDAATTTAGALLSADLVSPFDARAAIRSDLVRLCRRWPAASAPPPAEPGPMPDVPTLVLGSPTNVAAPWETARRTAARFPRATLVVEQALFGHPLLGEPSPCLERALERFDAGRTATLACGPQRPLVPARRPPPTSLARLPPVERVPGARGRVLRAVELTLSDWIDDYLASLLRNRGLPARIRGTGLRGGRWSLGEDVAVLERLELIPGVRLSARWDLDEERTVMDVEAPRRLGGRLTVGEADDDALPVRGHLGGRRLRAKLGFRSVLFEAFANEVGD